MSEWPHSPPHRFFEPGTYMITAGTYLKAHIFNVPEKCHCDVDWESDSDISDVDDKNEDVEEDVVKE